MFRARGTDLRYTDSWQGDDLDVARTRECLWILSPIFHFPRTWGSRPLQFYPRLEISSGRCNLVFHWIRQEVLHMHGQCINCTPRQNSADETTSRINLSGPRAVLGPLPLIRPPGYVDARLNSGPILSFATRTRATSLSSTYICVPFVKRKKRSEIKNT